MFTEYFLYDSTKQVLGIEEWIIIASYLWNILLLLCSYKTDFEQFR